MGSVTDQHLATESTPLVSHKTPIELLIATLQRHLDDPAGLAGAAAAFEAAVPHDQRANIDAVLDSRKRSYPPALLIQLAFGLTTTGHIDISKRQEGARGMTGVAGKLGKFLAQHHVPCAVPDAFQNVGKNTADLIRGSFAEWDQFLKWAATSATRAQWKAAFEFACARIAATSRPVSPMPELNLAALTFSNVSRLFAAMFDTPSEGAHEQFIIAAVLHGLISQAGNPAYRVETKKLNSSDASARAAGDIQILTGSRLLEAYEVTANDWGTKVDRAEKTIRDHDLSRLHIVAKVGPAEHDAMVEKIRGLREDVSVIEIRGYASAITAALTKPFRAAALERLYQFLDRYQSDVTKVNAYVERLKGHGLTLGGTPTT
jgi:hypothetical protein